MSKTGAVRKMFTLTEYLHLECDDLHRLQLMP